MKERSIDQKIKAAETIGVISLVQSQDSTLRESLGELSTWLHKLTVAVDGRGSDSIGWCARNVRDEFAAVTHAFGEFAALVETTLERVEA